MICWLTSERLWSQRTSRQNSVEIVTVVHCPKSSDRYRFIFENLSVRQPLNIPMDDFSYSIIPTKFRAGNTFLAISGRCGIQKFEHL